MPDYDFYSDLFKEVHGRRPRNRDLFRTWSLEEYDKRVDRLIARLQTEQFYKRPKDRICPACHLTCWSIYTFGARCFPDLIP